MKRLFWGGLLVLLVACGGSGPEAKVAGTFVLSVDPSEQTVQVSVAGTGASKQDGARSLVPGEDLAVTGSEFVFLPGNVVSLALTFENVSSCTFNNLSFSRGADSRAVVSSAEPEVSSADLGGDGALAPAETTRALAFGVTHMGKPFVYAVAAAADVTCAQEPTSADLQVDLDARSGSNVVKGKIYEYYANVKNNGPAAAAGVKLTVTVPFPVRDLPQGCSSSGNTLTCSLGQLAVNASKGVLVSGTAGEVGSYSVSATASATTPDPKKSNDSATKKLEVIVPTQICEDPVRILDAALEKAVRRALNKPTGNLTCANMEKLTMLDADADLDSEGDPEIIDNLQGLQFAVNLTTLSLNGNNVSELGPLSGLTKLTELDLNENSEISDLKPLSGLTKLTKLLLYNNKISDLTPLKDLADLTELHLGLNKISDLDTARWFDKPQLS